MEQIVKLMNELRIENDRLNKECENYKILAANFHCMLEFIIEAHGESITTDYTIDSSEWKLKEYINETFEEMKLELIDFPKKENLDAVETFIKLWK